MTQPEPIEPNTLTHELPPHLRDWQLPPGWSWGTSGVQGEYRHYQEVIDALGRSLSLVSAPDPAHYAWLHAEARMQAHSNHPTIPTTYHYWTEHRENGRGPGYLRRWIAGETVGARIKRLGPDDVPSVLQVLRAAGSALTYLHDTGRVHGALSADTVWLAPTGRMWLLAWQWALPLDEIPAGLAPSTHWMPRPPEWPDDRWLPSPESDQWLLAALCFTALTGERPPSSNIPPLRLLRPDCPASVTEVLDRALLPDPAGRFPSVAAMLRAVDRVMGGRTQIMILGDETGSGLEQETDEARLRWAVGDDYEILASLGAGSFGSVWRARDLTLGREVALKMLHPHVARDQRSVARFRREARLTAQLAHPAFIPIYDWDGRGDVSWYTMELAEAGSVAELIARSGPRPLAEIAPQIDFVLGGLAAAHAIGIIHRDLKPENVLIDRYGRWRLSDFGIANVTGEEQAGPTGTPAFAAPEQLLGEAQGPAADCFGVAAIVAFALRGAPPFGETDGRAILARELAGQIDLSGIEPPIAAWLRRGLAADPELRFADAGEMQLAWRAAVTEALDEEHTPWWRRWLLGGGLLGQPERPTARR